MALKEDKKALILLDKSINPIVNDTRKQTVSMLNQIFLCDSIPARMWHMKSRQQALRQWMSGHLRTFKDAEVLFIALAPADPIHMQNRCMRCQAGPNR
jgi:hypothetical protein